MIPIRELSEENEMMQVPGTRVFMVAPDGYRISHNITGFEKQENAIMVMDLPEGNFYSNAADFNRSAFESRGIKVNRYEESVIDSFPAKYLEVQNGNDAGISAVFGDSSFSVMVTGVVKNGDTSEVRKIRESIFHLDYQKKFIVDPLADADFTLDDSHSKFKFSNHNAMLYLYTIGGEEAKGNNQNPFFMVMELPRVDGMDINAVVNKISMSMEDKGFYKKSATDENRTLFQNYPAMEYVQYGNLQGEPVMFYSLIIQGMYKYYCLQGIAKTDFENELKSFKDLANTFKMK